jgi:hypothetical protein
MMAQRWGKAIAGMLLVGLGLSGLGCSGVGDKLLELSGTEVRVGVDATHPADFPLAPPSAGEISTSMRAAVMGIETVTVQYKIPASADAKTLLDGYEQQMRTAGLEIQRTDEGDVRTVVGTRGTDPQNSDEVWTASIASDPAGVVLSLIVIKRGQ